MDEEAEGETERRGKALDNIQTNVIAAADSEKKKFVKCNNIIMKEVLLSITSVWGGQEKHEEAIRIKEAIIIIIIIIYDSLMQTYLAESKSKLKCICMHVFLYI